ncbi:hypothetical protein BH09ACT12_BH09ACT12_12350 [soil metagenome]
MIRFLACALLIPLLVVPAAGAAPAATAERGRPAAAVVTSYDCDSDFGSATTSVRVSTRLPRSVRVAQRLGHRVVRVSLTIPEALVDQLRAYGVRAIEGSSDVTRLRVGRQALKVRDVTIPHTPVPDAGSMTLRGIGTADAFSIRRAGEYPVRLPGRLKAHMTADFGGSSASGTLACAVTPGAPRRLTSLLVRN